MQRIKKLWHGIMLTPYQIAIMQHITDTNPTDGITADEVRHLVGGEILTARSLLHRLAKQGLLKKRIVRKSGTWNGGSTTRKIAVFYPN